MSTPTEEAPDRPGGLGRPHWLRRSRVRVTLMLLCMAGCGRQSSPGENGPGNDGGFSGGTPPPPVQIVRQPGRLEGSPSFALVVPRLDAGIQISPFDAGPGPVSE